MENYIQEQEKIDFEISPLLIVALVNFGYELWLEDSKGLSVMPTIDEDFGEADFNDDSSFLIGDD